jgi:uncharacterized membrane protein HdeD (DUF308 family)
MLAVGFGVAAILAPEPTLVVMVSLFGIFALADGVFTMGAGLALNWLTLFLEGIVGVAIGAVTLLSPTAAELGFVPLVVAWAIINGAMELTGAYGLRALMSRAVVRGEWLLAASGIVSLAFGVAMAVGSQAAVAPFMWMIGGFAMLSGMLLTALALNIRTWPRMLEA